MIARKVIPGTPAERAEYKAMRDKLLAANHPGQVYPRTVGLTRAEWRGGGRHIAVTVTAHTGEDKDGVTVDPLEDALIKAELAPGPPTAKALTALERSALTVAWARAKVIEDKPVVPDVVPDIAKEKAGKP